MKDKTQYEALMEELHKIVENLRVGIDEVGKIFSKLLPDIEILDEEPWKMKCPYYYGDEVYILDSEGETYGVCWECRKDNFNTFNQGNTFQTEESAELESERRKLLTMFKTFRDECNEDWKPEWNDNKPKYFLFFDARDKEFKIDCLFNYINLHYFGYFKKAEDAQRAIELFGNEIKRLYVDCEGE